MPTKPIVPFQGDRQQPSAGSDLERLCALATSMEAGAVNQIGAEMRSRYMTSSTLNPAVPKLPETTTEGNSVMAGWRFHGKKR